jgi:hypothetical protein
MNKSQPNNGFTNEIGDQNSRNAAIEKNAPAMMSVVIMA